MVITRKTYFLSCVTIFLGVRSVFVNAYSIATIIQRIIECLINSSCTVVVQIVSNCILSQHFILLNLFVYRTSKYRWTSKHIGRYLDLLITIVLLNNA